MTDEAYVKIVFAKYGVAILFMQMRKIPEVKLFGYPSTITPTVWGACMPNFEHITVIGLVQEPKNTNYCDIWADNELCTLVGRHFKVW